MISRNAFTFLTVALGLFVSPLMAKDTEAQKTMPERSTETFGAWTVTCQKQQASQETGADAQTQICSANQILTQQASGQRILSISAQKNAKTGDLELIILAPFGLDIRKPVTLQSADNTVFEESFTTCLPAGCVLRSTLDETQRQQLAANEKAVITFTRLEETPLKIEFSTKGFGPALARLQEK